MRYAQIRYNNNRRIIEIRKYGSIQFSPGHTEGGILCENEETVKVITNFIKREGITARNVYINISDPSIVVRIVKVPRMEYKDLKDYLDMEISQYLPVDFETNTYDYKVLNTIEEEGKLMMNLLLTSVSRELVQSYVRLFKAAGLNPRVIDVYPNSVARVFGVQDGKDTTIVDINGNSADFVILENGKLFMYSTVFIENSLSCSNPEETRVDMLLEEDKTFAAGMGEILNYIRTYMNFFSSRHFGKNVDTIYILGEPALIKNIDLYFSEMLQVEVKLGLPGIFSIDPKKDVSEYRRNLNIDKIMAMYSCNIGLALRGE